MEKLDRRIQRTHKLLTDALVALALRDGYDAVTIRDITDQANISYSTFFRHYPDKDALLMNIIQTIIEEMSRLVDKHEPAAVSGAVLFHHVADHLALYRVLLGGLNSSAMVQKVQGMICAAVLGDNPPSSNALIPPEIAANHIAASALALVKWWLDHDMPYPPERMGAIYAALVIEPIGQFEQNG